MSRSAGRHYPARVRRRDDSRAGALSVLSGGRGIPVGSVAGIPIFIAPSWVLSVAVITALGVPVVAQVVPGTGTGVAIAVSILLGLLLGASVLAHELGHCLAARLLGVPVFGVRLYMLGGVSELARLPRSPREEAIIAAAGPAVSAVLAGIFWAILQGVDGQTVSWLLLVLLALANAVVAVFNLLPALPLDGGRVVRAGIWKASGNRRSGTTAAVLGGYVVALGLMGWAAVLLVTSGSAGLLPAGIAVAMALFVVVGATQERNAPRPAGWTPRLSLPELITPVVPLPAETPVAAALEVAADREVILTDSDGIARGLLDADVARRLAAESPQAPAAAAAQRLAPEAIVLADDQPEEIFERLRSVDEPAFLLVDHAGQPSGVIRRDHWLRALAQTGGLPGGTSTAEQPGSGR